MKEQLRPPQVVCAERAPPADVRLKSLCGSVVEAQHGIVRVDLRAVLRREQLRRVPDDSARAVLSREVLLGQHLVESYERRVVDAEPLVHRGCLFLRENPVQHKPGRVNVRQRHASQEVSREQRLRSVHDHVVRESSVVHGAHEFVHDGGSSYRV